MTKLIGITAGEIVNKARPWSPVTYGQSYTYIDSIIHAGGVPVILPLTDDTEILRSLYESVDGILFPGGNDIDPKLYGEEPIPATEDVSVFRDKNEAQLMEWALEDKKPILCICRGMELLNVVKGGSLHQDILADMPDKKDHESSSKAEDIEDLAHNLKVEPASKLAKALEATEIKTNTHHHQAINVLGEGLKATAWSEDGVIEGIETVDENYVIGVQSHPESLEAKAEPAWRKLFSSFVEAVSRTN